MPKLQFQFVGDHTQVDVEYALLAGRPGLDLCVLQLANTAEAAMTDAPRAASVIVLRDLLVGGPEHPTPALQDMIPGGSPALVVAPEYAFGSSDWAEVDAIVRASKRPIVLLAGFGATVGRIVLEWQASHEVGTIRHLAWDQKECPISSRMRLNGGWCWIHEPGGTTHCIVYLKNFLQQGFEAVKLDDLQVGKALLHLRFADLDLFPLICADLIQPAAQNRESPQARLQRMLQNIPDDRRTLVVGSLLQTGFNKNWAIAIDSLLNVVLAARHRAIVALCNIAHDQPLADEAQDQWRSLSGVFARFVECTHGQKSLPVSRALNAQNVVGAVIRLTAPSVAAGTLAWQPYTPTNGEFIWRGNMAALINAKGIAAPIVGSLDTGACEISRFLRRHPPGNGCAPRLAAGLDKINEQLSRSSMPRSAELLRHTLHGVNAPRQGMDPDALSQTEVSSALKTGLHALATLASIHGIEWQNRGDMSGQLRAEQTGLHFLVWRSPEGSPRSLVRALATWRLDGGPHPYLLVFGATPLGELPDGEIKPDRRDDISVAPSVDTMPLASGALAPVSGDITAARSMRKVAGFGLSRLTAVYADYEEHEDESRVQALLEKIGSALADMKL